MNIDKLDYEALQRLKAEVEDRMRIVRPVLYEGQVWQDGDGDVCLLVIMQDRLLHTVSLDPETYYVSGYENVWSSPFRRGSPAPECFTNYLGLYHEL